MEITSANNSMSQLQAPNNNNITEIKPNEREPDNDKDDKLKQIQNAQAIAQANQFSDMVRNQNGIGTQLSTIA
ncbi:MAG: hypothetical protein HQK76_21140 [Desulfobacterales bacterium]|nr:hypothetical protein [Desulfobacterales bacterium]